MEIVEIEKVVREILPRILREHPEVRFEIEKLLRETALSREEAGDRFEKMLAEIRHMREESERRWQEWIRERDKIWEQIEKMEQESERRWQEWMREWREERRKIWGTFEKLDRKIDRTIGALGARWGLMSEKAFRDGLRRILEELTRYRVERYWGYDEKGEVFGHPDQVEIDVLIRNGEIWAVEIKSSVSWEEVYVFERKVKFYENREGRKVSRKLIISPMVEPRAFEVAQKLGIEVYTAPEDIKI
ncbi:PD-(D/E)XK nuclease family protein [Thermosulfurimonas sp. F29]|uniref:PD-(D/E)XK nuclease family protein n=1 Tax=Thermosulfurimonas sp. F29 TaxID=2867247 RepID=UPI001C838E88|nr:DUF3782 domain-containing protein [Thermosulfurimonas sp. F29]MBX6422320.1 DUF3782 domain-containing protein [Thermosulfurimonas sp. F29]